MSNRVTPDGLFMVRVALDQKDKEVKRTHQTEMEIPVVVARDAKQAEVLACFAVRTLGLKPQKTGHKVRALTLSLRTKRPKPPVERGD